MLFQFWLLGGIEQLTERVQIFFTLFAQGEPPLAKVECDGWVVRHCGLFEARHNY